MRIPIAISLVGLALFPGLARATQPTATIASVTTSQTEADSTTAKTVTLNGSGSSDPDGGTITTYAWTLSQDSSSKCALSNSSSSQATLSLSNHTTTYTCTISLSVTDSQGERSNNIVDTTFTVSADNDAPIADAGADQTVSPGATVTMGNYATDYDTLSLTYTWTQSSGTTVSLVRSPSNGLIDHQAQFTAPTSEGVLVFVVTASDGTSSSSDTVTVTVNDTNNDGDDSGDSDDSNSPPIACLTANKESITAGESFTLDASCSSDPDGDDLTYTFTQTSGETATTSAVARSAARLISSPKASLKESALDVVTSTTKASTLVFEVEVSDGTARATASATIRVFDRQVSASRDTVTSKSGEIVRRMPSGKLLKRAVEDGSQHLTLEHQTFILPNLDPISVHTRKNASDDRFIVAARDSEEGGILFMVDPEEFDNGETVLDSDSDAPHLVGDADDALGSAVAWGEADDSDFIAIASPGAADRGAVDVYSFEDKSFARRSRITGSDNRDLRNANKLGLGRIRDTVEQDLLILADDQLLGFDAGALFDASDASFSIGETIDPDLSIQAEAAVDGLAIGDVNGDDFDDIVIGSNLLCSLYLFFGDSDILPGLVLDDADTEINCENDTASDDFGENIDIVDFTGDDLPDIAAATGTDDDSYGRVDIVFGRSDWPEQIAIGTDGETFSILGTSDFPFSSSFSFGDMSEDGVLDLIINRATDNNDNDSDASYIVDVTGSTETEEDSSESHDAHAGGGGCSLIGLFD